MANQKISARTVLTGTGLLSTPLVRAGSTTNYRRVDNLAATADPAVGDDDADGFHVGSIWFRSDTGEVWFCRSASTGAASWSKLANNEDAGYLAGNWYFPPGVTLNSGASSAPGAGSIKFIPWRVRQRVTVSELAANITTLQAAENFQLAIYANDKAEMQPTGNALGATGNISTAATGRISAALAANATLQPGLYWLASNCSHATPIFTAVLLSGAVLDAFGPYIGNTALATLWANSGSSLAGLSLAQAFGTWPDVTASSFAGISTLNAPVIAFKVASVP